MLALDRVHFAYPGDPDPFDFTLTAAPGEIVAIAGPSGAGKSTLLDLVAGFVAPSSGTIVLDGNDITPLPPETRPVSILFQSGNLFEHLTAGRNLALALPPTAIDKPARIAEALDAVGLSGLERRLADQLSGGQQQRAALARTLLLDRPILLLDEPFAALDATTATAMRRLVRDTVKARNWHALLVSHQPDDLAIADTGYVIENRRLKPAPFPAPNDRTTGSGKA